MKKSSLLKKNIVNHLFYGGIDKNEYIQVKEPIAKANLRALKYWSVLVSLFWIYCIVMSFNAADYGRCRPAYITALSCCVFTYLCSAFLIPRFPKILPVLTYLFRMSLLGGGIGIAACQGDVRSLTLFAVAIVSPSIFVDSTVSSLMVHISALVLYILVGSHTITPEIYHWGLGNYCLFSVFGLLIGNAINKERFERYVYAEYEKKLAEVQRQYAYIDRLTGLKNRHAYEDMRQQLEKEPPEEFYVIMVDINGLKMTNDTIGHSAGDELIIGTSECLSAAFEGTDSIYRIGGDEFCIVLFSSLKKARLCVSKLEELASKWHGSYINRISVCAGVASSEDHVDMEAVFDEADKNMYENKYDYYMTRGVDRRKR